MPQQDFLLWVIFYGFLIILLPIAVGAFRIRHLDMGGYTVFLLCIVSFLFETGGTILWLTKTSNLWLGHLYTIIEFVMLANVYRYALRGFIKPVIIPAIMVLFTLLAIINTLFLQGFKYNNSNIKIIEATLLITFALIFFYKLVRQLVVARLEKHPMFWVNCAVLIYFSSNMFIFLYSNYLLLYSKSLGIRIWFIHSLFFILFYIFLAVSLWIVPRNSNSHG
jgi:hypothetical protein